MNNPSIQPPWSTKKRLSTTFISTFIILCIALFSGGLFVFTSKLFGLNPNFSFYNRVQAEIAKDPQFVNWFYQNLNISDCVNHSLNFKVSYSHPLKPSISNPENNCTEFKYLNSSSLTSYVKLIFLNESKNNLIEYYSNHLTNLTTNNFSHQLYDGTVITGLNDNINIKLILLSISPSQSVIFFSFPHDPSIENELLALAKSYTKE